MYLLDTNIVPMLDPRHHARASAPSAWLKRNEASLFLAVLTIAEMDAGILKLGREDKTVRADELSGLVRAILADFDDRVLPVDDETARHVARLGEQSHREPIGLADLTIAATAVRHGLILLTRRRQMRSGPV